MKDVEFMSKQELEDEVLALRHKLSEMTTQEVDWLVDIKMPKQLARMLKFLEFNKGRVCTMVSIHEALFGAEPETIEKSVQVQMCNLRKRLKAAGAPVEIRTHWGQGYSLHDLKQEEVL